MVSARGYSTNVYFSIYVTSTINLQREIHDHLSGYRFVIDA